MDRRIVYVGAIPQDIDVLQSNLDPYFAVSKLADAVLGKTQILNNFACAPTSPAGMTVNVGFGEVYSLQQADTTSYGSISANTNQIVKQGVTFNTTNLSCPAPGTVGYSVNYLVQISFTETDTNSSVLPYYNSANINAPLSGPGNSGASQPTIRQDGVTVSLKTGIAALTGTQTTPSPDTGYTGAYVVTVAYGQTSIISGNISQYSSSSFIQETLTQKVSQPTGDLRWAQISRVQSGFYWFGADTGTTNSVVTSITPAIVGYSQGNIFNVLIANTNTTSSTININSVGSLTIKLTNGNNINPGDLLAGMLAEFQYDGTHMQLLNPASTVLASQIQNSAFIYAADTGTANSYLAAPTPNLTSYTAGQFFLIKILHTNTAASTININTLGAKNIKLTSGAAINVGDLVLGQIAGFVYDGTNFQLLNPATWTSQFQVQNGSLIYSADTGSTNAYVATLSPAPSSYVAGMAISLRIANINTGASTLNLNSLGTKNIVRNDGSALVAGDLPSGMLADLRYDGTNFQLMNPGIAIQSVNIQRFTSPGSATYTPTSGMKYVIVQAQAAGGGGGGAATSTAGQAAIASGGSGGEYIEVLFTASQIGVSKNFVVGAGGTGGSAGANNGTAGGNTTFNTTWIITNGGNLGVGGAATSSLPKVFSVFTTGGNGGSVSTGTLLKFNPGQFGGAGIALNATNGYSGAGGNGGGGATGGQSVVSTSAVGATGGQGGGGSGAITMNGTQQAGANGIDGYINFIEYIGF